MAHTTLRKLTIEVEYTHTTLYSGMTDQQADECVVGRLTAFMFPVGIEVKSALTQAASDQLAADRFEEEMIGQMAAEFDRMAEFFDNQPNEVSPARATPEQAAAFDAAFDANGCYISK